MGTLVASEDYEPFDITTAPIWAIPQLTKLNKRSGFTVIGFEVVFIEFQDSRADITVHIKDEGIYYGILKKSGMETCPMPSLYFLRD